MKNEGNFALVYIESIGIEFPECGCLNKRINFSLILRIYPKNNIFISQILFLFIFIFFFLYQFFWFHDAPRYHAWIKGLNFRVTWVSVGVFPITKYRHFIILRIYSKNKYLFPFSLSLILFSSQSCFFPSTSILLILMTLRYYAWIKAKQTDLKEILIIT